jgi:peptide/nickel transport system substrate-binding protein
MLRKFMLVLAVTMLIAAVLISGCSKATPTTSTAPTSTAATSTAPTSAAPTSATATATTTKPTTTPQGTVVPTATSSTTGAQYGGTLTFLSPTQPAGPFGWPLDMDGSAITAQNYMLFEPLIRSFADDHVEPLLAESWTFAADNLSITFKLRQGVKFHDGSDFNSEAMKFIIDHGIAQHTSQTSNFKSVDAPDNYTLRINFKTFVNNLWAMLSSKTNMAVSIKPFKDLGEVEGLKYARLHPCGTGPFMYADYKVDQSWSYVRNPNYWQTGRPYPDKLVFINVKDQNTIETAFLSGVGQVLATQQGRPLKIMKDKGYDVFAYAAGVAYLGPDSKNPGSIFADKKVRLALDYAIDKVAICNALGYGYWYPTSQLVNTPSAYYNPNIPLREYDVAKAKQLLTEAGYPNGFKTTLTTQAMFSGETQLYQQYLAKVGIDAKIVMLDNAAFFTAFSKGWTGLLVSAQSYPPNFASGYKTYFSPGAMYNPSIKFPDDQVALGDAAITASDPKVQKDLTWKLLQNIYDDETVICIYSSAYGNIVNSQVHDADWLVGQDYNAWRPDKAWLSQ